MLQLENLKGEAYDSRQPWGFTIPQQQHLRKHWAAPGSSRPGTSGSKPAKGKSNRDCPEWVEYVRCRKVVKKHAAKELQKAANWHKHIKRGSQTLISGDSKAPCGAMDIKGTAMGKGKSPDMVAPVRGDDGELVFDPEEILKLWHEQYEKRWDPTSQAMGAWMAVQVPVGARL
ncbi:MAG: hypothetical protein ACYCU7_19085 [Acidimicrobiales bacterium]